MDYSKQYIESFDKFIVEKNELNIQPDVSGDVAKKTSKSVSIILSDDRNSIKFTTNVDPNAVHVLQSTDPKSQKTKIQFYVSVNDIAEVLLDILHAAAGKTIYGYQLSGIESIQIVDSQPEEIKVTKSDGTKVSGKYYVFDDKLEFKIKDVSQLSLKIIYIPRKARGL